VGIAVGIWVKVAVGVCEAVGVGGKTICVTKLHASVDEMRSANTIRFVVIAYP
jgi:hypothetical protein